MNEISTALLIVANAALWLALNQIWENRQDDNSMLDNRDSMRDRDISPDQNEILKRK